MQENIVNISFENIFKAVRRGVHNLKDSEQAISEIQPENYLKKLIETTTKIGTCPIKRPPPQERYMRQWVEFSSGRLDSLDVKTIRYLCWEPDVATQQRFIDLLDRSHITLSPYYIRGLVHSCHMKWNPSFASGPVVSTVGWIVSDYQGPNHIIKKWKNSSDVVLGASGTELFAREMLKELKPIKEHIEGWGFDSQSAFVHDAVRCATGRCRDLIGENKDALDYLFSELFAWPLWELSAFKTEIGNTILHRNMGVGHGVQEKLQSFILSDKKRLGDPRLRQYRDNWTGISEQAQKRFMGWLSRIDILFFFEHVLPDGEDPHGRKDFWLRYVNHCISRPLLCRDDEESLKTSIRLQGVTVEHRGVVRGGINSAFFLDFGPIIAVEFSKVGACYLYSADNFKKIVPDFWTNKPLNENNLRDRRLCICRTVHRRGSNYDWQGEVATVLARYGIRQYEDKL